MRRRARLAGAAGGAIGLAALSLAIATVISIAPPPASLAPQDGPSGRAQLLDRQGQALSVTYDNAYNLHDVVPLHEIPALLRQAMVEAEDRRFFEHGGVDWRARAGALAQNLRALDVVRGASTITEQVARLLHPRPRSAWSRWLQSLEARALERRFSKPEIFEYYLNQVPYGGRRRGVAQAAREYFDRSLETLRPKEMLALAVIVRSPQRFDPRRPDSQLERAILRLAERLARRGLLDRADLAEIEALPLELGTPSLAVTAPHFVRYARVEAERWQVPAGRVRTTLDGGLQARIAKLLAGQIARLGRSGVRDGAVLVVDHERDEVLAWVNAGSDGAEPGSQIDAVLTRRQPGSTLKPFLYAAALDRGLTAATLIEDAPFAESVGSGLHPVRNYSRVHHGPLRLREALGNSLNVPAVRTARTITIPALLATLHELGFDSLDRSAAHYGDGLALGSGEVTLYELVSAYATLARGGVSRGFHVLLDAPTPHGAPRRRVFSEESASLVADILSDPDARRREFGAGGLLELPVQTAVKTGTSSDYRDAWAIGFSHRHTVGIWMGNLDRQEMNGVSGSIGPAIVLRAVFADLRRRQGSVRPLYLSRKLRRSTICRASGEMPLAGCPTVEEWFRGEDVPHRSCALHAPRSPGERRAGEQGLSARWVQPTPGLHLALDPRIPDELEAFPFRIETGAAPFEIEWFVDGTLVGRTGPGARQFAWSLSPGAHVAHARARLSPEDRVAETERVAFVVK